MIMVRLKARGLQTRRPQGAVLQEGPQKNLEFKKMYILK